MKTARFLLIVSFFITQNYLTAQWELEVRLTNDQGSSMTGDFPAQTVGASGNLVYTVWMDDRDGNYEIYFKASVYGGLAWLSDTRLTNYPGYSVYPSTAISGSIIHVVWKDDRDGNYEIYYKRATNNGASWGADTRLTLNSGGSENPSVTVSGSDVYLVWTDLRDGNAEIYFKKALDNGLYWGNDIRLTNAPGLSMFPVVAASGAIISVVWMDKRDGNEEIYYKRSTNAGQNWGADTRLTYHTAVSTRPFVTASGSYVHVVWQDERNGNKEIYYQRSLGGGSSWATAVRLTNNSAESWSDCVTVSGSFVHVVWTDNRDGNYEIYYKLSTNNGQNWGADTRLINSPNYSVNSSVIACGAKLHVVWSDSRDGNFEIYYKRNPTGNSIGIEKISSEVPEEFMLYQNYPNPFNPKSNIKIQIAKTSEAKLVVYDVLGREIAVLVNEQLSPGTYEVEFEGTNYPSGVYYYKLQTDEYSETKKMVLIK